MKSVMVSLTLVGICFSAHIYSMEERNKAEVENHLIKAQKLYDKGQESIEKTKVKLVLTPFTSQEEYNMFVETERSKAKYLFSQSRLRVLCVLNNENADEVTKQTASDLNKKIDQISWASQ